MLFALATSHKIGLACMGAAFIIFSLVSSFVLPARNPNFPGKGLRWYIVLCIVFFLAMLSSVLILAKESKGGEAAGAAEAPAAEAPAAEAPAAPTGDATAGKAVFTSAGCGACHTFAPAAASGKVGPDLDKLAEYAKTANQGSLAEFTRKSITDPGSYIEKGFPAGMPPNGGATLSPKQLDDLVAFLDQG